MRAGVRSLLFVILVSGLCALSLARADETNKDPAPQKTEPAPVTITIDTSKAPGVLDPGKLSLPKLDLQKLPHSFAAHGGDSSGGGDIYALEFQGVGRLIET